MRIAQVAPLYESVPPLLYGGTERIVYNLTERLVALGHDVTLFASGDSSTSAKLIPTCSQSLRMMEATEPVAPHMAMFEKLRLLADDFDLIHFHNEYLHLPTTRMLDVPTLSTLHGRLDLPEYEDVFSLYGDHPFVSISESQRRAKPNMNWAGCVYHGLPSDLISPSYSSDGYLAFLGRITREKRIDCAIEIARRSGKKLKVAAKIPAVHDDYVKSVLPLLNEPFVEFVGEIGDADKTEFLGGAEALLFPIDWPEPFGLVMIESLAAGTPVIAFPQGSVPEVIDHGRTGFIVSDIEGAVAALSRIDHIDRRECRREFERRFSNERMTDDYISIYESLICGEKAFAHMKAMGSKLRSLH